VIVRRIHLRALAAGLILGILPAGASAGNDLELSVGPVERVEGFVCVSFATGRPLTPRLEETLMQGMPATVTCEVGLWKRRSFWFDKLVVAIQSERKVVYDLWGKSFRIRSGSDPPVTRAVAGLDSLGVLLFSGDRIPVVPADSLHATAKYYATIRLTIQPLSVEDLGEIEDWLAGDSTEAGAPKGIPRYLMDLAVSLSGLGERTGIAKSQPFVPSTLATAALPE